MSATKKMETGDRTTMTTDKTILDSAVVTPCVTNTKYIGNGLLNPDTDKISEDVFGLIHPEQ